MIRILYRPFDYRYTYYTGNTGGFHDRPRHELMQHLLRPNLALVTTRLFARTGSFEAVLSARGPVEKKAGESSRSCYVLPLYTYPATGKNSLFGNGERAGVTGRRGSNLKPALVSEIEKGLKLRFLPEQSGLPDGRASAMDVFGAEDVFHYVYAVLHSPTYRERYAEFLKIDFPRLPLTRSLELFRALAQLGGELVALQLMESPKLGHFITRYIGPKNPQVGLVGWSDDTVWLDAAATKKGRARRAGTLGFCGVPEAVWNFHIGGYQVCEKWLKDRKGRSLSDDDIVHYQKIVVALAETLRLMREIDEVIEQHGGWPGAFAQGGANAQEPVSDTAESDNVVPPSPPTAASPVSQADLLPPLRAVEPEAPPYAAVVAEQPVARREPDELDREELICRIRQLFSDGENRGQDAAIGALARDLGHQHPSNRIRENLDAALRIAVGRGILEDRHRSLRLAARNVGEYERNFLKEQFLASLSGRPWIGRDDAIRAFARWMGFRRTGRSIEDTARSLINGLVRERRLESDGSLIRRSPQARALRF
jgi:hypothetical protein